MISEKIRDLAEKKQALIIAHNYQSKSIREIAHFTGDSLELSRKAAQSDADLIVFCGVTFMAETAKILKPGAKVLIPRKDAGCPMADMADPAVLARMKKEHPDAAVCSYVNSYADIKNMSDVCCTSSNAVKIVNSLPQDEVIMLPDQNLASWVARNSEKKIIPYQGHCYVHQSFHVDEIHASRKIWPDALVIAHPECDPEILSNADHVASTSGMINFAKETDANILIFATERGVIEKIAKANPDKKVLSLGTAKTCFNMKKITLEDLLYSLENEVYEIVLDKEVIKGSKKALDLMLELSS